MAITRTRRAPSGSVAADHYLYSAIRDGRDEDLGKGSVPLVACPQCGKTVADVASVCPGCGHVLGYHHEEPRTHPNAWWIGVGAVVVLTGVLMFMPRTADDGSASPPATPPPPLPAPRVVPTNPAPTPTAPRSPRRITRTMWTSTWANVREGRGTDTPIVQIITPGQRIEVDSLVAGWWTVVIDGTTLGYVHTSTVQDTLPPPGDSTRVGVPAGV